MTISASEVCEILKQASIKENNNEDNEMLATKSDLIALKASIAELKTGPVFKIAYIAHS